MSSPYGAAAAQWTAASVRQHIGDEPAELALILGSGLGAVADDLEEARSIRFSDIPGFSPASVVGHAGKLVSGMLGGHRLLVMAGRIHAYEGHSLQAVAFPVRVLHALGARTLFVSNAAGGIRRDLEPGDLMILEDHLNLMFDSPLAGQLEEGDERFPDMSSAYDPVLREQLSRIAFRCGITPKNGVYAALRGPAYETPAEIRMLERMGADAVGMSTVPEVAVARALGMRVVGASCITNVAAGITEAPLSHAEVLATTAGISDDFRALIRAFVAELI
ncbi:MAG TPA: purine-nucleoside phosphorylase [Gemmatimonadaceae bacterium]|nr:purine-nucleoside phosphorylase [Gemmatimonadaceae bacterium]